MGCIWKVYDRNPQTPIALLQAFMAGFTMDILPTDWPGKTLLVMWMRCCGTAEERMQHSSLFLFFLSVTVYSKFFYCFVVFVQLCVGWQWDVYVTLCCIQFKLCIFLVFPLPFTTSFLYPSGVWVSLLKIK